MRDERVVRQTRLRLGRSTFECDPAELESLAPSEVIDERWRPRAEEQRERRLHGEPLTDRLVRLSPSSRRALRALGPLDSLLVDG